MARGRYQGVRCRRTAGGGRLLGAEGRATAFLLAAAADAGGSSGAGETGGPGRHAGLGCGGWSGVSSRAGAPVQVSAGRGHVAR